jgi:STE24 endopeptidase
MELRELFDQERRNLAAEYNQRKDRYRLYKLLVKILFWGTILGFSLEKSFYQLLVGRIGIFDLRLVVYIGGVYLLYFLVEGSLNYLLDYRLDQEYNLSNQSTRDWLLDQVKMLGLSIIFVYLLVRAFLAFGGWFGDSWWLAFAGAGALFTAIINFIFPVVLFPLFFEVTPYPESDLKERLWELVDRTGLEAEDIYEFNLSSKVNSANAAVMGLGKTRKILLGDNLEDKYTPGEIEAVLAHELGHQANNDIFKQLLLQFINLLIVSRVIGFIWPSVVSWFGYQTLFSPASVVLFLVLFGMLNFCLRPIELFISRRLETKADRFALKSIETPKNLATAFAKLADQSLARLEFNFYELLFRASHPAIKTRVKQALIWEEDNNE